MKIILNTIILFLCTILMTGCILKTSEAASIWQQDNAVDKANCPIFNGKGAKTLIAKQEYKHNSQTLDEEDLPIIAEIAEMQRRCNANIFIEGFNSADENADLGLRRAGIIANNLRVNNVAKRHITFQQGMQKLSQSHIYFTW